MDRYIFNCALGAALLYRPEVAVRLIERFGCAEEVFKLREKELAAILGGDTDTAKAVLSGEFIRWAEQEVKW